MEPKPVGHLSCHYFSFQFDAIVIMSFFMSKGKFERNIL